MFSWIRSLFRRNKERGRSIFAFHDGIRKRKADPIATLRKILDHPEYNIDVHPMLVRDGDSEATAITVQAVCDVFGVDLWTEEKGGLTELEALGLLNYFMEYAESLKKNIESSRTSRPSSEPIRSPSSEPTTNDIAPSTSSANGRSSAGRT